MIVNPVTLILVGVVGGLGAVATYGAMHYAEKTAPKLSLNDLRPSLPWEGLPLPRFFYTKPQVIAELRRW